MSQLFTLVTYISSFSSLHVYQKAPRTSRAAAIAIRIKDNESFVRVTFPKSCCEDGVWLQPRITNLNGLILYDRSRKRDGRYFSCNSISMHEIRELQIRRRGRHENEFFRILSSARARTNVILAGKFGSHRQSATSFSEKVGSGKNKLSNVRSFIIQRSGEGFISFNGNKRTNFCGEKKYNEATQGVCSQRMDLVTVFDAILTSTRI